MPSFVKVNCTPIIMSKIAPNHDDCEIDIELYEDEYSLSQEEKDGIAPGTFFDAYCFSSDMYELLTHLEDS